MVPELYQHQYQYYLEIWKCKFLSPREPPRPTKTETLEMKPTICFLTSPPSAFDAYLPHSSP